MCSIISEILNIKSRAIMHELYSVAKAIIMSRFFGISVYICYTKELLY